MEQRAHVKIKFFTINKIFLTVFSIFILFSLAFFTISGLRPIASSILFLLYLTCFILIVIWALIFINLLIKRPIFRKVLFTIAIIIPLVLSILISPYIMFFSSIGGDVVYRSSSPSGKNSLIVFEGGFIDAYYNAYPVKCSFFYKLQNNGFVSKHDHWGGAEIKVDWISEKEAHVKIDVGDFMENDGSNKDDIIIVTFNVCQAWH